MITNPFLWKKHNFSYDEKSLEKQITKSDFLGIPKNQHATHRANELNGALEIVSTEGSNFLLKAFHLKKKTAYRFQHLGHELVARKLAHNIKYYLHHKADGRSFIISNIYNLLEEEIPYRIYRLDIESFYESFNQEDLIETLSNLLLLSPKSISLLKNIFAKYSTLGGKGIPRGLAMSATLSEVMMQPFDMYVLKQENIFCYSRFVDDIFILTNAQENHDNFIETLENHLPRTLNFHKTGDKHAVLNVEGTVSNKNLEKKYTFSYLGYQFLISNKNSTNDSFRSVTIDIADQKVKRIKKKICRAFLDYQKMKNFSLLTDRLRFLRLNYSIYDTKRSKKKLAGIFYSYPQINTWDSLLELDKFLKTLTLAKKGYLNKKIHKDTTSFTSRQKRILLENSFEKGHREKKFIYFSPLRLNDIKKCWINE